MPDGEVMPEPERRAIDLFAGAGGWAEGLASLGIGGTVGVELDADACATSRAAGHPVVQGDATALGPAALGPAWGICGSPPCPGFSTAGKRLGMRDLPAIIGAVLGWAGAVPVREWADARSPLTLEPLRWIDALDPEWVALEQVPDVLPVWHAYAAGLRSRGWSAWAGVLNAADHGVPQTRRRAVLIASQAVTVVPPSPTRFDPRLGGLLFGEPWVSMEDALGWDGLELRPWRGRGLIASHGDRRAHPASGPAPTVGAHPSRFTLHTGRDQRPDGTRQTRPTDRPAPTVDTNDAGRWTLRSNSQANAAVRDADQPASTVFCGNALNDVSWVSGPETTRVEVWELGVLQGFRRDYPWQGCKTSQARQVGNAIPVGLAAAALSSVVGGVS